MKEEEEENLEQKQQKEQMELSNNFQCLKLQQKNNVSSHIFRMHKCDFETNSNEDDIPSDILQKIKSHIYILNENLTISVNQNMQQQKAMKPQEGDQISEISHIQNNLNNDKYLQEKIENNNIRTNIQSMSKQNIKESNIQESLLNPRKSVKKVSSGKENDINILLKNKQEIQDNSQSTSRIKQLIYNQQNKINEQNIYDFLNKPRQDKYVLDNGIYCIPHPDKQRGEDSSFISENLICIADGVGGNRHDGNDPAKFSKELTQNIFHLYVVKGKYKNDLDNLVNEAFNNIKQGGSSTLVLIELDQQKRQLHTYQIGDSLYMIIRKHYDKAQNKQFYQIINKSPEMQIRFNCPYQLCSQTGKPQPRQEIIQLGDNDLVILGSDGLFDNLTDEDILEIVRKFWVNHQIKNMNKLSEALANQAYYMSLQEKVNVPFIQKVNQIKNMKFKGGKKDDISVVCSRILK